jgi:arylsulfatase A-like enzyme
VPAARRGATNDDFVLNADLAPTILSAAGSKVPAGMQGKDFAPLYLAEGKPAWRDEFFYEQATIRSKDFIPSSEALVRRDVKYNLWPEFDSEELFDLKADRGEVNNLAKDPARAGQLADLRKRFAELKAATKYGRQASPQRTQRAPSGQQNREGRDSLLSFFSILCLFGALCVLCGEACFSDHCRAAPLTRIFTA